MSSSHLVRQYLAAADENGDEYDELPLHLGPPTGPSSAPSSSSTNASLPTPKRALREYPSDTSSMTPKCTIKELASIPSPDSPEDLSLESINIVSAVESTSTEETLKATSPAPAQVKISPGNQRSVSTKPSSPKHISSLWEHFNTFLAILSILVCIVIGAFIMHDAMTYRLGVLYGKISQYIVIEAILSYVVYCLLCFLVY